MRAGLFLVALLAFVASVNAATFTTYSDGNCTKVTSSMDGIPTNQCVASDTLALQLTCADNTSPWSYAYFDGSSCDGSPISTISGANADACSSMGVGTSQWAKVICNSAAAQSVSALLIVALAFVANKLRL